MAFECHYCSGRGRRRAHIVVTVLNVDTGVTASACIVPELIRPVPVAGGWRADLSPWVRDLADQVGVVEPHEVDEDLSLVLPDASAAAVANALAARSHRPWLVFCGHATEPEPPDRGRLLGRLCHLADLLCLDLVVEARPVVWSRDDGTGLYWEVRFEVPGGGVPVEQFTRSDDLSTAVLATSPEEALRWLSYRSPAAPAYWIKSRSAGRTPPTVDLDQVERRTIRDCAGSDGAQAVWRDGRWHHTSLRVVDRTEEDAGQVTRRVRPVYQRGYEPPPPSFLDSAIPVVSCADVGRHCPGCRGTGRIQLGAVVTLTDLDGVALHVNWRSGEDRHAEVVATQPGGKPVLQLGERFRLRAWAAAFGVDTSDLYDLDDGCPASQDWFDGHVTALWTDREPVEQYLAQATAGRPGARIVIRAAPPHAPPLTHVIRLALGLDLAAQVTLQDLRHNAGDPLRGQGLWWGVALVARQLPVTAVDRPRAPNLASAVATCLEYLDNAIAKAVPDDPDRPISAPQQPTPVDPIDVEPVLRRHAAQQAGTPVMARIDRAGCAYFAADGDGVCKLL